MPRTQTIPEEQTRLFHIAVDETCTTRHKWMVIGSIRVGDEHVDHVRAKFLAMKERLGFRNEEIKWERCNEKRFERYVRLTNAIVGMIKASAIQFHCIRIEMDVADLDKYVDGDPDIGYNIYLGQLLLKYLRAHRPENKYHVVLDERTTKVPLDTYKTRLNFRAQEEKHGGLDHFPFRKVVFADSKKDLLLQITDLLLGAVGHESNDKHKPDRYPKQNPWKNALARHVRVSLGLSNLLRTGWGNNYFTIWPIKFNSRPGKKSGTTPGDGGKPSKKTATNTLQ